MKKTTVLVVDDSALIRSLLSAMIDAQPDLKCIGAANDPLMAREMIRNLNPDVLTLDVEMPKMDGIDFLEKLMRLRPMPVVMVSTLTERGAEVTLRALELGAVDFVAKPKLGISTGLQELGAEICEKIRAAARARIRRAPPLPAQPRAARAVGTPAPSAVAAASAGAGAAQGAQPQAATGSASDESRRAQGPAGAPRLRGTERLVAIGASTGGTEAIREVLVRLAPDFPAVVITQHMPPGFTASFAKRLDTLCQVRVKEAEDGERLLTGHAYIAPGGRHLSVTRSGANYVARLDDGEPVNRHRPSVERLFDSVASAAGPNVIGLMLTGMGRDGAQAMKRMRDAGAWNIAQDERTCVVFGMPREAIAMDAVDEVLPLQEIAAALARRIAATGGAGTRI
ncbi:MAG: chemotaxis response regulator protein-glutamate methylesterase [Lautropia sp.]